MDKTRTEPIATARLMLRPLCDADADAITRLAGDLDVARWTAVIPHPYPPGEAARYILQTRGDKGARVLAITRRAGDDALIGMITLRAPGKTGRGEIGYWLGRPYWGQGLMSEAVAAVIHHAVAWHRDAVISAKVFPGNTASARVLEKAGFVSSGTERCETPGRETPHIDGATLFECTLAENRRSVP